MQGALSPRRGASVARLSSLISLSFLTMQIVQLPCIGCIHPILIKFPNDFMHVSHENTLSLASVASTRLSDMLSGVSTDSFHGAFAAVLVFLAMTRTSCPLTSRT